MAAAVLCLRTSPRLPLLYRIAPLPLTRSRIKLYDPCQIWPTQLDVPKSDNNAVSPTLEFLHIRILIRIPLLLLCRQIVQYCNITAGSKILELLFKNEICFPKFFFAKISKSFDLLTKKCPLIHPKHANEGHVFKISHLTSQKWPHMLIKKPPNQFEFTLSPRKSDCDQVIASYRWLTAHNGHNRQ